MHYELVPGKVLVKIYNREFDKSTHYYLGRHGSLDEIEANHNLILQDLNARKLCVLEQVHGADIEEIKHIYKIGHEPVADGSLTDIENIALGIQTADCVPVLLASEDGSWISGLHCGWRSAFSGIIENVVEKIRQKTSKEIIAVIGPSIQQASYEVGEDYYINFVNENSDYAIFFARNEKNQIFFDIAGFVQYKLEINNIKLVQHFNDDTFLEPEKYPSHRYANINKLGKYKGSILSVIYKI